MHRQKPTLLQKKIELTLGALQLEEAFYASPEQSQVREELRAAKLMAESTNEDVFAHKEEK